MKGRVERAFHIPLGWHSGDVLKSVHYFRGECDLHTASILAKVLDKIEMRTTRRGFFLAATSILESNQIIDVLVNNRVFDRAAKHVIRIGPKTLWKLVACANERYVLPNQIWTINHAMALRLHLPSARRGCSR